MRWYIVHGRRVNDDDDATMSFYAESPHEAVLKFTDEICGGNPGVLILIAIWDCGENKPMPANLKPTQP